MDKQVNMENANYATNDDTPLWTKDKIIVVFLYKCNCIRIMFLNTYNKNVDIIYQVMVSENDELSQILRKMHWSTKCIW